MVEVGDCLRLDALRGVNDEYGALTRPYRPAHLVGKIDVARGVDQVQQVSLTVFGVSVYHGGCLCKDCDASLSFDLESVEDLCFTLFQLLYRVRHFEHAVRQGRLPMVDMCDYREVADAFPRNRG